MKYICKYTDKPIKIDGNLAKIQWQKANRVNLVDVVTGAKPAQQTTAMMLWDDNFLYAAFDCEDNGIIANMTEYNDLIYNEDVVELFIDSDGSGELYTELEVNPNNAILHYLVRNIQGEKFAFARVDEVVTSAVCKLEGKTHYEFAIPLSELSSNFNSNNKWRFNFYRIDRGETDEYTAFSPTGAVNYHVPKNFADLEFEK